MDFSSQRARDSTVNRFLDPSAAAGFYGRGRSRPTIQESCPSSPHDSSDATHSLLQSISCAVSEMQRQLVSMQEQSVERDLSIEKMRKEIESFKKDSHGPSTEQAPAPKRCRKSPRGLSACVRRVHGAFNDSSKYLGTEGVTSDHNMQVTRKIVNDIVASKEFTDRQLIEYASKKHHEYLVRLEKQETDEAKENRLKSARIIQRRVRLYERRVSQAKGREIQLMRQLSEKLMSDEETDSEESNSFIKKSPPWRSEKLDNLLHTLDKRYEAKQPSLKKDRKIGPFTGRVQPQGVPTWALHSSVSEAVSSEPSRATSDELTIPRNSPSSFRSTPTVHQSSSAGSTPNARRMPSSSSTPTTHHVMESLPGAGGISTAISRPVWRPGMTLPTHVPVRNLQEQSFNAQGTPPPLYERGTSPSPNERGEESDDDNDGDSEMDAWIHAVTGTHTL